MKSEHIDVSSKIVYNIIVKMMDNWCMKKIDLIKTRWLPCSKTVKKFGPLQMDPVVSKVTEWKPSLKAVNSGKHSVKG